MVSIKKIFAYIRVIYPLTCVYHLSYDSFIESFDWPNNFLVSRIYLITLWHKFIFDVFFIIGCHILKLTSVKFIKYWNNDNYDIYNNIYKNDHNYVYALLFEAYSQYS